MKTTRRGAIAALGFAAASITTRSPAASRAHVVIVGAGYGGTTVARHLLEIDPGIAVTVVERDRRFISCPKSNEFLAGLRSMESLTFGHDALKRAGARLIEDEAVAIDAPQRMVKLRSGASIGYDRLVLSPGIDFVWTAIDGFDAAAAETIPHAWEAGDQTILLRRRIEAMPDGGLFVMSIPADPYRCPPGPYERASLVAWYLKQHKPRSKILLLDGKDRFSKQPLFEEAWKALFSGIIEWVPASAAGRIRSVNPATMTVSTDFDDHKAAVANIIPPQQAGRIATDAGLTDQSGFCPVDPVSFESKLAPGIHLVGDAIVSGDMPKSAFSANAQGMACARALSALLRGDRADDTALINTCYSIAAPKYGFSIAGVYKPDAGRLALVKGSGGLSPVGADSFVHEREAVYGESWFRNLTTRLFA